ncbi:MAG: DNA recombination protein RmuC [Bacilli bacterium]|nr:DNA recombination protein RmuC [Bacilli bacterium]
MEYIVIGLLIIIIILLIVLITRKNDNSELNDKLSRTEISVIKEIGDFKHNFSSDINKDFNELNDRIERKLNLINQKVNEKLEDGFDKTNKTFNEVMNRLTRIDEAQKKIDGLGTEIISLESILTDKKSRGIFGEVNLYHILSSIFGEKNDRIYRTQYTLSNTTIADAIVFGPEPLGTICIDAKFPLENYRRLVEKGISDNERALRYKAFDNDVKKHIDAIASKYIIPGETSDQAIMFLPAEAIFAEINAYHTSLIKYAASKKVWITSPTTLMSLLTIIEAVLKGLERDKYTSIIHEELNKLGVEFGRYKERWDKLSRTIQTVNNDVENIHKTTEKITKRFDSINNVKLEDSSKILIEENN